MSGSRDYPRRVVDEETLRRIDGLHVGQLSDYERQVFDDALEAGMAKRTYSEIGYMLGLSKVKRT